MTGRADPMSAVRVVLGHCNDAYLPPTYMLVGSEKVEGVSAQILELCFPCSLESQLLSLFRLTCFISASNRTVPDYV